MNDIAVITTATEFNDGVHNFLASCKYYGYQPLILGWGQPWMGNVHKAQLALKAIKQLKNKYPVILSVDSYDMIFTDSPDAILAEYRSMNHMCVYGSERYCYPDAGKAELHPVSPTPYRYLNGGGFIGESWYVEQLFDYIAFDKLDPSLNDQDVLQQILIDNPHAIKLDYECRIFQTLVLADDDLEYGDEIRNIITGQVPKIIHGNGHWDMTKAIDWLNSKLGSSN
jgi:hypothetical protein